MPVGGHSVAMSFGEVTGTPADLSFDVPFKFTGKLDKIVIDMK